MPTIDVTDVVLDPDFAESFVVRRRTETISDYGRSVVSETETTQYGSIQPEEAEVDRGDDGQRVQPNIITVHTPYRLVCLADDRQPDVVIWDNREFIVMSVSNWSKYGRGFIAAKCHSLKLLDTT